MTMGAATAPAPALPPEVELLERALALTCGHLARARPVDLGRPTPCAAWDLGALLLHMEDSLDAFAEAASGFVTPVSPVRAVTHPVPRVPVIQAKATALLGSWVRPTVPVVRTGSASLPARVLLATAALEVAVHGWDLGAALAAPGPPPVLPDDLALRLLPIAEGTVDDGDRPARFAAARHPRSDAPAERLLAHLGR